MEEAELNCLIDVIEKGDSEQISENELLELGHEESVINALIHKGYLQKDPFSELEEIIELTEKGDTQLSRCA